MNPQTENGFIRIAGGSKRNDILLALIHQRLNGTQYQVMLLVIRKTWGFNKKKDWISLTQFERETGKHRTTLCHEIGQLVVKNLLVKLSRPGKDAFYTIQKDFSKWISETSRENTTSPTSRENAHQLVGKTLPTKETITKENNTPNPFTVFISRFNTLFGREFTETDTRRKMFNLRVKRFGMEKLMTALEHLGADEFCKGKNDRGWTADPDYLLRTDEKVDQWLNKLPVKNKMGYNPFKL